MKLYSKNNNYKLYQGNMMDMLEVIKPETIDSIVTDPPYGLTSITKRFGKANSAPAQFGTDGAFSRLSKGFMGKEWDGSGIEYNIDTWQKCYEVLKPGGYLLAFGGSRTFHRIACAIEDAGFEIRDTIMWLYGSGFPKSMSLGKVIEGKQVLGSANVRDIKKLDGEKEIVGGGWNSNEVEQGKRQQEYEQIKTNVNYTTEIGKKWDGWGTALKPSFEPIIVARKPFKGSLVDNVLEYGVGGINIDECRVGNEIIKGGTTPDFRDIGQKSKEAIGIDKLSFGQVENAKRKPLENHTGRFPANTILTYDETDFDEVCGGFPDTKSKASNYNFEKTNQDNPSHLYTNIKSGVHFENSGSASRYFYCAKASKKDRDEGLEEFEDNYMAFSNQAKAELKRGNVDFKGNEDNPLNFVNSVSVRKNTHPTVKPTELMQYLVRLVTPNGGTILDPFNGSGSTGKAVMYENNERNKNYKYIGIELTEEYLPIAKARIEYAFNKKQTIQKETDQLSLFDIEEGVKNNDDSKG